MNSEFEFKPHKKNLIEKKWITEGVSWTMDEQDILTNYQWDETPTATWRLVTFWAKIDVLGERRSSEARRFVSWWNHVSMVYRSVSRQIISFVSPSRETPDICTPYRRMLRFQFYVLQTDVFAIATGAVCLNASTRCLNALNRRLLSAIQVK